jgi:hypothetical protein
MVMRLSVAWMLPSSLQGCIYGVSQNYTPHGLIEKLHFIYDGLILASLKAPQRGIEQFTDL